MAFKWINNYLKTETSLYPLTKYVRNISCGVPQGSMLGSKLFILCNNDISNISSVVEFMLFADDTNIFHASIISRLNETKACLLFVFHVILTMLLRYSYCVMLCNMNFPRWTCLHVPVSRSNLDKKSFISTAILKL